MYDVVVKQNENQYLLNKFSFLNKQMLKINKDFNLEKYIDYFSLEMYKYHKEQHYEIKNMRLVYDNYLNPYIMVEYNPIGMILFSMINNESVVLDLFNTHNVLEQFNEDDKLLFNFDDFSVKKVYFPKGILNVENEIKDKLKNNVIDINETIKNNQLIDIEKKLRLSKWKLKMGTPAESYSYDSSKIIKAEKEVSNAWWFKTAVDDDDFGYADDRDSVLPPGRSKGLCHYVAGAMLLQYAEFFWSSDVFSENQYNKYFGSMGNNLKIRNYGNKMKIECPRINTRLTVDLYENKKYGNGAKATTSVYFRDALIGFLNNSEQENYTKKPNVTFHRRSAGWIKPWKWIRDDKPCIVFGLVPGFDGIKNWHAVTVYGLFDNGNKVLCHYGWSNKSQVILSTSLSGQLWLIGMSKTGNDMPPKKYFKYNNNFYSGPEITEILRKMDNE
ncbi:putative cysteine peptidase [[Mycoplasma] anseris]|uniref:Uncharacterized protein n=1 Tax=[Mycoplasma] anseris TaxID=92400 RepID=A0A2Z4NCS3_9BACT|nr:hypothetical protein [[Mycoplasma] anseris]AWX69286.1 hypothetical protein DP065_00745 [[Mycoplasma] anseris]